MGQVVGTDAFLGVVIFANRETLAYVCDGTSIAQWFRGPAGPEALALTAEGGARLNATLTPAAVTGTVTLADGRAFDFTATPATGEAGLYRAHETLDGVEHVAGWVVLPDGQQRGAITAGGRTLPAPRLTPATPTVPVGGGTLHAQRLTPTLALRTAAGANAAAIQAAVEAFRADLGGANNGVGGSFPTGRREINWDGVPDQFAAPNNLPADFFNKNSPRGAVFATPGSGVQVSANEGVAPVRFGTINPTYAQAFTTFSPQRLFAALGATVTEVTFFVPGTATPATVSGFGAVFTDVDQAGRTTLEYFTATGTPLGRFVVPPSPSGGLSFLGVSFPAAPGIGRADRVARVRITTGTHALAAGINDGGPIDLVVMDDFLYGEPQAAAQPR